MLDVAIVIVSWNVREYLANCLQSIFADNKESDLNIEVWVVDNASTDGSADLIRDLYPQVHLIANGNNPGFGAANNQGMRAAAKSKPRFYFLLNPDTLVGSGSISRLVTALEERPEAGMVGARLVYGDGRFQHSAFTFPGLAQLAFDLFPMPARMYESRLNGRYPRHLFQADGAPFHIDHPLGATMLLRAEVFDQTGGFDESFHMYCEEIDWSWRIQQAGWDILAVPAAEIIHYGGESTKQVAAQSQIELWRSRARLYRRQYGPIKNLLARLMVTIGMNRRASQTANDELSRAYREITFIWQSSNEQ